MFELNQAIGKWRGRMAREGIKSREVLDELESHLREEIAQQIQAGLREEDAFQGAVAKLGEEATLRAEFAKVQRTRVASRLPWWWVLYFVSVGFVLLVSTWTLFAYEVSPLGRVSGLAAVLAIVLYLGCLPRLLGRLSAKHCSRLAAIIKTAPGFVCLWSILELLEAEHVVRLGLGIVPVMVMWCLCAAAALSALAYGLLLGMGGSGGWNPPPQWQRQPLPPTRPTPRGFGASLPRAEMLGPVAREVLVAASEEATRLGHSFIGTEHVLLALLRLGNRAFEELMQKLHLEQETVRAEIVRLVGGGPAPARRAAIPFTPRACKALELAAREAGKFNKSGVTAEDIFLGLALEGSGVAGQVLRRFGVSIRRIREELVRELRRRRTSPGSDRSR